MRYLTHYKDPSQTSVKTVMKFWLHRPSAIVHHLGDHRLVKDSVLWAYHHHCLFRSRLIVSSEVFPRRFGLKLSIIFVIFLHFSKLKYYMINLEYAVRIYSKIVNIHFYSPNRVPGKSIACLAVLEGTFNCLSSAFLHRPKHGGISITDPRGRSISGLSTKSTLTKESESLYAVSMFNVVSVYRSRL
jgi:hypothetical protein